MIQLTTLGEIGLRRSDGTPASSVLQQPRRFALLCYLAVAGTTTVRRDTLLGLFWPEKPEEDARHDLSQAIHYLRRALGREVIQGGRTSESFALAPGSVSCDARQFLAALKQGDRAEALRLYRGDFLPGFFVSGSPDLEQWLEAFRGELRRRAAAASWQLAEAEAEANPVGAAGIGRRAVELSLGDEAAVRRLIELLDRIGDRAGACEAYAALHRRLADEYGVEPSPDTVALMTRLRASSDATAAVDGAPRAEHATADSRGSTPPSRVASRTAPRQRPLRGVASAAVTAVLLAGFVSLWGLSRGRAGRSIVPTIVVEEPGDYSRTRSRDDLAGAVTTDVLARLTGVGSLQARTADADARGDGYGADHLLLRTGLIHSVDSVRVTAVLLDGRSRIPIDRAFLVLPAADDIALIDEVAGWLARFARTRAGSWVRERQWRRRDPRGHALDLIRTALQDRARADSLRRGSAVDAALASYRMADSLLALAAKAAPDWSEPAIQRAETALRIMWLQLLAESPDVAGGRASVATGLRHAELAAATGDPAALELRAVLRYWFWRTAPADSYGVAAGSLRDVEKDLRRALERDPTRARAWNTLASLLTARGDFGEARWAAERAAAADAFLEHVPDIVAVLFSTSLETGDRASARRWCDDLQKRHAGQNISAFCELMLLATFGSDGIADVDRGWASVRALRPSVRSAPPWAGRHDLLMGVLLARAGAHDSAAAMLKRGSRSSADPESAILLAWGLLALGQVDSAAAVLERYASPRPEARAGVLRSERFAELREHPRIARLIRSSASVE